MYLRKAKEVLILICSRQELYKCIQEDKNNYIENGNYFKLLLLGENKIKIYKFIKLLRYTEYHCNNKGIIHKILYLYFRRKKNYLGRKLGIEISENSFESNLTIFHAGNIVVNGSARIGKNCKLHGSNCIGNNGITYDSPVIADNVRLGVGAKVIGGVTIAENITIAAGAIVVNSFLEPGITIAGIPARKVK